MNKSPKLIKCEKCSHSYWLGNPHTNADCIRHLKNEIETINRNAANVREDINALLRRTKDLLK